MNKPLSQQLAELPARADIVELRVPVSAIEIRERLGSGVTRLSVDLTADGVSVVAPTAKRKAPTRPAAIAQPAAKPAATKAPTARKAAAKPAVVPAPRPVATTADVPSR